MASGPLLPAEYTRGEVAASSGVAIGLWLLASCVLVTLAAWSATPV